MITSVSFTSGVLRSWWTLGQKIKRKHVLLKHDITFIGGIHSTDLFSAPICFKRMVSSSLLLAITITFQANVLVNAFPQFKAGKIRYTPSNSNCKTFTVHFYLINLKGAPLIWILVPHHSHLTWSTVIKI